MVTPLTMPAMMLRAEPYMSLAKRASSVGAAVIFLPAMTIFTTGAKVLVTLPLGPSTWTVQSLISTLTFSGMGTGCFPIRLMVWVSLPNVAEQFTAGFIAATVLVFHE